MRKLSFTLVFLLCVSMLYAQEKKEQLWYCWEETVIPAKYDAYIEFCNELIELCEQEKFLFNYYTWSTHPMTYQLWTPISSLNDIDKIGEEWDKIIAKWGDKKYMDFNATKIHNRAFTVKMRDDMEYKPVNPVCQRSEIAYGLWIEVYPKVEKAKEFEAAVKWLNEKRKIKDVGSFSMYGVGGIGYESPCHIVSYADLSQKDFLSREQFKKLGDYWEEYLKMVRPLMRKPVVFVDMYYKKELSYSLDEN